MDIQTELKNTVDKMLSEDYKERFKAEIIQVQIRYSRLCAILDLHDKNKLPFELNCPVELLRKQKKHMGKYLDCLMHRAVYIGEPTDDEQ